jgi:hypothetical protein
MTAVRLTTQGMLSIDQASILAAIAIDGNKIGFKVINVTHDRREK